MYRLGIIAVGCKEWVGGITYAEMVAKALSTLPYNERPPVSLIFASPDRLEDYSSVVPLVDEIVLAGPSFREVADNLPKGFRFSPDLHSALKNFSLVLPWNEEPLPGLSLGCWIPDFQHLRLPEFFSAEEIASRNRLMKAISSNAPFVILSSEDAKRDYSQFFPQAKATPFVMPFFSLPKPEWYTGNPVEVVRRYQLPEQFLICCNQFWAHKDHLTVFKAVAQLQQSGYHVQLVCTGFTHDYRHPSYFSTLQAKIAELGIQERVHILGLIPRDDQIQLLRYASAVVQPSLFEGWSTVVEDSRALGKRILLSKIGVHVEQNPHGATYFEPGNSCELAGLIAQCQFSTGPIPVEEARAQQEGRFLALNYARRILELCKMAENSEVMGRELSL